jgi:hypothetical protein
MNCLSRAKPTLFFLKQDALVCQVEPEARRISQARSLPEVPLSLKFLRPATDRMHKMKICGIVIKVFRMNFSDIIRAMSDPVVAFAHANPLIAVAVLVFLAFLIYRRPFFFLLIFLIGLLVVGALYFIMSASGSGVSVKERMIRQGEVRRNICRPSTLFSEAGPPKTATDSQSPSSV